RGADLYRYRSRRNDARRERRGHSQACPAGEYPGNRLRRRQQHGRRACPVRGGCGWHCGRHRRPRHLRRHAGSARSANAGSRTDRVRPLRMSLAKRIIPCLDVDNGRVVKGVQFVDIRDAGDPVEIARRYDAAGADELTFLDITASSDDRETLVHVVEQVASEVFIPLTVGGGIRTVADISRMLNAGADKVGINSAAVSRPEFISEAAERFGSSTIVVAIDAKRVSRPGEPPRWEVFTHGGRRPTGIDAIEWGQRMAAA